MFENFETPEQEAKTLDPLPVTPREQYAEAWRNRRLGAREEQHYVPYYGQAFVYRVGRRFIEAARTSYAMREYDEFAGKVE